MINLYFTLEAKHCPPFSDCRRFIDNVSSCCHRQIIAGCFDVPLPDSQKCNCCYVCIKTHADGGCLNCVEFLKIFFPSKKNIKLAKSVASELELALQELFKTIGMKEVQVEDNLSVSVDSFITDMIKMIDEISQAEDIEKLWHLKPDLSSWIFSTINEVVHDADEFLEEADISDVSEDSTDDSEEEGADCMEEFVIFEGSGDGEV